MCPLYKYSCDKCNIEFEDISTVAERTDTKCPKCKGKTRQLVTSFGIVTPKGEQKVQLFREHVKSKWESIERRAQKDPSLIEHNPNNLKRYNAAQAKKQNAARTGFNFAATKARNNKKIGRSK